MRICTRFIAAALLIVPALSASAETAIPRDTVIPVTLDGALGSATTRAGATFRAHHSGINGGGFPERTEFTGNIDSVTRASGKTAGQISVSFVSARLPDGTRVPILGQITSLDSSSVTSDSSTGRLTAKADAGKAHLKGAAIGAGAGLVLGQIISKKPLVGTLLGAAAGYLYAQKQTASATGKDVLLPAGARVGIRLTEDVTIPDRLSSDSSTGSTVADSIGSGWQVTFDNLKPVMKGNDLMVPFRSVMDSIQMPFDYNMATRQVSVNNYETQALHTVGTRVIDIDGKDTRMDAPSRIMNGAIYVPASYIELLTSRTAYWNQKSGVLRIE